MTSFKQFIHPCPYEVCDIIHAQELFYDNFQGKFYIEKYTVDISHLRPGSSFQEFRTDLVFTNGKAQESGIVHNQVSWINEGLWHSKLF
jgi:hypothetical protein